MNRVKGIVFAMLGLFVLVEISQPASAEEKQWSRWIDMDNPSGEGDFESFEGAAEYGVNCEIPVAIQCREVKTNRNFEDTGQIYTCVPDVGGICRNKDQNGESCKDYEVRFLCEDSHSPLVVKPESKVSLWQSFLDAGALIKTAIIAVSLLGIGLLGVFLGKAFSGSNKSNGPSQVASKKSLVPVNTVPTNSTLKKNPKKPSPAGMVVPGSTMVPVNSAEGLGGGIEVLNDALQATGRIGFAQEGVPTNKDVAFGTGFLISDRHVLTNRHVFEMYRKQLTEEGGGIEFFAERGSDATDFVPFNGAEPKFAQGLDIAIFELASAVSNRAALSMETAPSAELEGRDIAVIGYPCPLEITEEIKMVVEEDPVFAVKRLSEGKIFKHTKDLDDLFGVETDVSVLISPSGKLNAICHDASTLGGSSGSPVLDKATGQLLGVHFGFDVAYDWAEGANFAIPIADLIDALKALGFMQN